MPEQALQRPFGVCGVWLAVCLLSTSLTAYCDQLEVRQENDAVKVFRTGEDTPILTQHARPDFRPYIHPITAPDGKCLLTEDSPTHHPHQTGLYWGFSTLNGRNYFTEPGADHWRRVYLAVLMPGPSETVQWQTIYDLLDSEGNAVLRETQTWTMRESNRRYTLDLRWEGDAFVDVLINEAEYGGLFLRMPWHKGVAARAVNSLRQADERAEGQRAVWLDLGLSVEGRDDEAHIAILDHPDNSGFPHPWRVDGQFGVGPARARLGDWTIAAGKKTTIQHRLLVYTGALDDVGINEAWTAYSPHGGSGGNDPWIQWNLAREEGRNAAFLRPDQAVAAMTMPDGFQVNAFASEPMITQPMAFCWDDRGRLWIAENRDYEARGEGFSNSGDSRILILEDTDHDGVADQKKVFLDGIPFPAAIAVGFDGLWLGAPPNLLFVPDRDGDDRGDTDAIEVRLTGWGIRDRHETLNSFHWGPDGWLYGTQGFATPSQVGKPAGAGRIFRANEPFPAAFEFEGEPVDINGGVWRYHPTKERFEVVAHGFSNPWGIDFDANGQLFITACVIPHIWHVIPGGIYQRQGGAHFNPNVYSDIQTIGDHRHRSAHGGARVYLSDAFPEAYHGQIFMANIHEHAVLADVLEPDGSGFVAHHGSDFMFANNAQFVGFSMEIGPEGGLYVLDWHDAEICGSKVLNKDTGRVYRIMPEHSQAKDWPGRMDNLGTMEDAKLVDLQTSVSAWHARRARLILQHRAAAGTLDSATRDALRSLFRESDRTPHRLRALWALHVTGGLATEELLAVLNDSEAYIRAWGIQLACEDRAPADSVLAQFQTMAASDNSPVVRLYLAAALQRISPDNAWTLGYALAAHGEDTDDHNIPKMLWFGLEPIIMGDAAQALTLAKDAKIPLLSRHIARRLAVGGALEPLAQAIADDTSARESLLLGLRDGLDGQPEAKAPVNWTTVYGTLRSGGGTSARIALDISLQFGDEIAARTLVTTLDDATVPLADRRQALEGLAKRGRPELLAQLPALLGDEALRRDAIRAVAAFDDETLGKTLLDRYATLESDERREVVHAMAGRSGYGWQLAQAIKGDLVPRRDVPAYIARQLHRVVGSGFLEIWGPIDPLPETTAAAFDKFRGLLTAEAIAQASPERGRAVFRQTCAACHTLNGEGGRIGPDLTGANRADVEYLLANILTPSADIQDAYKTTLVLTNDGMMYTGVVVGEDDRQVQLRVVNSTAPVSIPLSQIESRELSTLSMMPEGLLDYLEDDEVANLFAYLGQLTPVP